MSKWNTFADRPDTDDNDPYRNCQQDEQADLALLKRMIGRQ